jgi:hypothetical protein
MDSNFFYDIQARQKGHSGGSIRSILSLAKRELAAEMKRIKRGTPLLLKQVMSKKKFPRPHKQME